MPTTLHAVVTIWHLFRTIRMDSGGIFLSADDKRESVSVKVMFFPGTNLSSFQVGNMVVSVQAGTSAACAPMNATATRKVKTHAMQ
jgi:hypothetical protein